MRISANTGLVGGVLERPADKFPSIFGRIQFLHDYPYALPGFVTASIGLIAGILSAIFLREVCDLRLNVCITLLTGC